MISYVFILYYWEYMKRFIEDALEETNTSKAEYWEDKLKADCTKVYLRIWREIVNTHEDYFWNYWTTDIQQGATEYNIQRTAQVINEGEEDEYTVPWIDKVKRVYLLCGETYMELPQLSDYQERTGMKGWVLKDNHIILTWTPEEDIENWLKLEGTEAVNEPDWDDNWEDDIFPWHDDLKLYQPIVWTALKINLWRAKQDFDRMNIAKQEYAEELMEMKRYITERVQSIYYTNLTY